MSVYVDDMVRPYGRMLMCHMIADKHSELLEMARLIGVPAKHIQNHGSYREHFDICKSRREDAVARGAVEITQRDLVKRTALLKDIDLFADYWDGSWVPQKI